MQHLPTAETALASLWNEARSRRAGPYKTEPGAVQRLAQTLGEQAMHCIGDTIGGHRGALVRDSATVLQTLLSLWAACGLAPDEIWIELHKREQLGSLLMQLNQAKSRAPRRLLKPWKVDSTKLP